MNQPLPWEAILNRHAQKWEDISLQIEQFEDSPMLLITEVFKDGDLFLAERLKREGDHVLFQAQDYWMSHLLPVLYSYFDEPEIRLLYDVEQELSPIYIQYQNEVVAQFSIYWRQFETFGIPGMSSILNEKKELIAEQQRLEIMLEEYENVSMNPDLLAEEDTWGYAKAVLRPKKHKAMMLEAIRTTNEELFEIQNRVRSLENQELFAEQSYVEISYCLDKIKRKVSRWGDFTFLEIQEEE